VCRLADIVPMFNFGIMYMPASCSSIFPYRRLPAYESRVAPPLLSFPADYLTPLRTMGCGLTNFSNGTGAANWWRDPPHLGIGTRTIATSMSAAVGQANA
jgi:hypothetical protein